MKFNVIIVAKGDKQSILESIETAMHKFDYGEEAEAHVVTKSEDSGIFYSDDNISVVVSELENG